MLVSLSPYDIVPRSEASSHFFIRPDKKLIFIGVTASSQRLFKMVSSLNKHEMEICVYKEREGNGTIDKLIVDLRTKTIKKRVI